MSRTGTRARRCASGLSLAVVALLAALPAAAQSDGPGREPGGSTEKTDPACASYGAGFTRLAGSSTCVKVSGSVQTDFYSTDVTGTSRVDALSPGLKSK